VHAFIDLSAVHFLEQISTEVERLSATVAKEFYLIAESDLNDPRVVRSREANGYGMDSQWSDDYHHSLFSVLYQPKDGETGYYDDFGSIGDLHKALKHAYVYDGQYSGYRKRRHGRAIDGLSAHHFVHFAQNHDQVGNRGWGERLEHLVGLDAAKVAIGLLLTAPYIPMLFMGEEWVTSSPFLYFADHEDEDMRRLVAEGRRREFAAFGFGDDVPNPEDQKTYELSKLNWEEQGEGKHTEMLTWVKALIKLRRSNVCLNDGDMHNLGVSTDNERRTLIMERDEARVLINFGITAYRVELLEDERLELISREGVNVLDNSLDLPPMTLAILMSTTEAVRNRQVAPRKN
jgi:maltooligosyltrehalose trehalohydrolase